MNRYLYSIVIATACALAPASLPAESPLSFHGNIHADNDISAITIFNGLLVIGADEAVGNKSNENYIQLLKQDDLHSYRTVTDILIYQGNKQDGKELDIEGITAEGRDLYVLGSHSLARKRLKINKSYKENRLRLAQIKHEKSRYYLFRLTMDDSNHVTLREQISLSSILNDDPVLSRFTSIPSKENGIDIEGIAVKGDDLYLGFRGPVLRDGYVPVMRLKFNNPAESYHLLFLDIEGRGIRDMAAVSDGFLILAGPVGNEKVSYQLLHWNGKDSVPGKGRSGSGVLTLLTEITPPVGGKAEGVAMLTESAKSYKLIIVFDSAKNGAPRHYTISKAGLESDPD